MKWGVGAVQWVERWSDQFGKTLLVGLTGPFGMIAYEIYQHGKEIEKAAEWAAHGISKFMVFHSPPEAGPLRDLGNGRLMKTLADSIRPAPVIAAAYRVANEVSMRLGVPAASGVGAPARAAGAPSIIHNHIHYAPVIHASSELDLENALRRHARVLADEVNRVNEGRLRLTWGY